MNGKRHFWGKWIWRILCMYLQTSAIYWSITSKAEIPDFLWAQVYIFLLINIKKDICLFHMIYIGCPFHMILIWKQLPTHTHIKFSYVNQMKGISYVNHVWIICGSYDWSEMIHIWCPFYDLIWKKSYHPHIFNICWSYVAKLPVDMDPHLSECKVHLSCPKETLMFFIHKTISEF